MPPPLPPPLRATIGLLRMKGRLCLRPPPLLYTVLLLSHSVIPYFLPFRPTKLILCRRLRPKFRKFSAAAAAALFFQNSREPRAALPSLPEANFVMAAAPSKRRPRNTSMRASYKHRAAQLSLSMYSTYLMRLAVPIPCWGARGLNPPRDTHVIDGAEEEGDFELFPKPTQLCRIMLNLPRASERAAPHSLV